MRTKPRAHQRYFHPTPSCFHYSCAGPYFFESRESGSPGLTWGGNYAGFNEVPTTQPSGTGITLSAAGGSTETRPKNVAVNYLIKF